MSLGIGFAEPQGDELDGNRRADPQVSSNWTGVSGARQTILGIRSKTDSCLGGLAACCSICVEV